MFSRRHPFLFFSLIMCTICVCGLIFISLIVASAVNSSNRNSSFYTARGDLVGIIDVTGIIADSRSVINQIKQLRENKSIKAVVLRIDSPGGTVGPAQEIYREIQKTVGTKKIVVSMGTVAASGGYYIASAADGIMANPGTITGSIGVIIEYTNFKQLLDKIGVSPVVIKSGDFKDVGSPVREMTEKEEKFLQNFVDKTRQQFVRAVADGRKMPIEQVESLADGRIFTGEEAKENGLVDRLGNLEDAIEWAGRMAGIEGEINTIYLHEKRFTFLEELLGCIPEIFHQPPFSTLSAGFLYNGALQFRLKSQFYKNSSTSPSPSRSTSGSSSISDMMLDGSPGTRPPSMTASIRLPRYSSMRNGSLIMVWSGRVMLVEMIGFPSF